MDAAAAAEICVIQAFSNARIEGQPVDEMVDNLCCTWGERWKMTPM
jgi:hypothetical protein